MLVKFSIENYKSFKTKSVLSAVTSGISGLESSNIILTKRIALLKALSLHGPNASGKSNFLEGIFFMKWFVTNSSKNMQQNEKINVDSFRLNTATENKPSKFEVEFLISEKRYRYGFSTSKESIDSEWLLETRAVSENPLFLRKGKNFKIFKGFEEGKGLENRTRENALFLSLVAQFNGTISGKILGWFDKIQPIYGLETEKHTSLSIEMLLAKDSKQELIQAIKAADLGIEDLEFKLIGEAGDKLLGNILTVHKKFNAENELDGFEKFNLSVEESKGTEKFFNVIGTIIKAITNGDIVVIDEIDARLHPFLTKYIIKLFNSPTNSFGQIVFATHDTNLMNNDLMRRDQVYFVEKDKYGSSNLYSLVEFKHRKDSPIDKNYLKGKFGAIPFIDVAASNSN